MQPHVSIALYNRATVQLNVDLPQMVKALQQFIDRVMVPVWGRPATLTLTDGPVKGSWAIVFMDDADVAGALAYHTVEDNLPLAKVFVQTIAANGENLCSATSHELAEMLVDPSCELCVAGPDGNFYAYECCDPVEESLFSIDGYLMSDVVFPRWFAPALEDGIPHQYSFTKAVTRPFELADGGYQSLFIAGRWSEIFGSQAKADRFALEDRRGHRTEVRTQKPIRILKVKA